MIRISEKESCCGCSACMNICPKKCISMEADSEGFLYPKVDEKRCVDCHLCEKVCPVQNTVANEHFDDAQISINDWTNKVIEQSSELPEAYAAFIKDSEVRENSTSGGFFTAIAKWIIANGGVVYGVEIDQNCKIVHSSSDNVEQLGKYRGSKYVQSSQGSVYKEIENLLKEERWVLYTGTPCQCAGLRRYLGTKEYATLVVLDVFCHGVGSPKYWDIYVEYNKKKYKADIDRISFREKTYGYNSACMAVYFKIVNQVIKIMIQIYIGQHFLSFIFLDRVAMIAILKRFTMNILILALVISGVYLILVLIFLNQMGVLCF